MTTTKTIRVLLADDHEVLRDGLAGLIEKQDDMQVIGMVGSGRSAVRLAAEQAPDVVVMDIGMPGLNGIDATKELVGSTRNVKVLCLSMHKEQSMVGAMFKAGARGYLVKNCAGRELIDAIRTVAAGDTYISPSMAGNIVEELVRAHPTPAGAPFSDLTDRERQVLQLIAEGRNTKQIAGDLHISDKTVAAHRLKLQEKLNCQGVADLTRYAIRQGLVEV